jgi:hypothetical protein
MRRAYSIVVEKGRIRDGKLASNTGDGCGLFKIESPLHYAGGPPPSLLLVIASDGIDPDAENWEHVSVSAHGRPPFWEEMAYIKDLFWEPEETVIQFHPPRSKYINCHPWCLHLWRNRVFPSILPPPRLVGPADMRVKEKPFVPKPDQVFRK